MGSHKEYLTSGYMHFLVCANFHAKMFLAVLKNEESRRMCQLPDPDVYFGLILLLF